jgi:hypothetical protein
MSIRSCNNTSILSFEEVLSQVMFLDVQVAIVLELKVNIYLYMNLLVV